MAPVDLGGSAAAAPTPDSAAMPDELHPRHLALRVVEVAAIIAVGALAITALPGLGEVRARLTGADPVWVAAVVLAEVGSCLGYLSCSARRFARRCPGV
jgi:hypothetical protein